MNAGKKYIVAALAAVALYACQKQQQTTPEYKTYSDVEISNVKVHVSWHDQPNTICKILMGNKVYQNSEFLGCSSHDEEKQKCTIVMPKPKDFNDKEHLAILGHEVLHCFGADHE